MENVRRFAIGEDKEVRLICTSRNWPEFLVENGNWRGTILDKNNFICHGPSGDVEHKGSILYEGRMTGKGYEADIDFVETMIAKRKLYCWIYNTFYIKIVDIPDFWSRIRACTKAFKNTWERCS